MPDAVARPGHCHCRIGHCRLPGYCSVSARHGEVRRALTVPQVGGQQQLQQYIGSAHAVGGGAHHVVNPHLCWLVKRGPIIPAEGRFAKYCCSRYGRHSCRQAQKVSGRALQVLQLVTSCQPSKPVEAQQGTTCGHSATDTPLSCCSPRSQLQRALLAGQPRVG
jgi:hypothetical protein